MTLATSIAYAAIVFAGPFATDLGIGVTLALFTGAVLGLIVAWRSTIPSVIGNAQSGTAVVLGAIAAALAELTPAPAQLATLLVVIAFASLGLGLSFLLLGAFRLGNAIRYVPFPVIGGFLGYVAWLLARGAFAAMTGEPLGWGMLPLLWAPDVVIRWLPAVLLASALLVLQRWRRHALSVPALLVLSLLGFWSVAWLAGATPASLLAMGLVLEPVSAAQAWAPGRLPAAFMAADWEAILAVAPKLAMVSLVAMITLLMNASTLEVASRRAVDLNRELITAGIGNVAAGLGGGLPGYHSVSTGLLPHYLGTKSRLVGLTSAVVCAATLALGGPLLALVPKLLVGLVLLYLALALATDLALDRWPLVSPVERLVMVAVFATLVGVGFVEGIVLGIVAGLAVFAVNYARIGIVRAQGSGHEFTSNVTRPLPQLELLEAQAEAVHVVRLQGYLFFGTAHRLLDEVTTEVDRPRPVPLRFLVLDFKRVESVDSSAIASFLRLVEQAERKGFAILLAAVPSAVARLLEAGGRGLALPTFPDLDHCLEHVEDRLIGLTCDAALEMPGLDDGLRRAIADPERRGRVLAYARPVYWPAGATIIEQGARSDEMYLFDQGVIVAKLVLADGSTVRVRTILPGTVVGEIGCYLDTPRTLSLVAATEVRARGFDRAALERMRAADPDLAADFHAWMARLIAERLAHLTGQLAVEIGGDGRPFNSRDR